jgi:hypothetical protein
MTLCQLREDEARALSLRLLRSTVAAIALVFAASPKAQAQLVGSVTVENQFDVRGVSLDDGKPDMRLGLAYDHPSGAYGGVSGIVGDTVRDAVLPLGYVGYLGFARPIWGGAAWDVGVTSSQITLNQPASRLVASAQGAQVQAYTHRYHADYIEVYGGVSMHNLSARLYLSPDYLNQGVRTAYLDLNAAVRPMGRLRLNVHAGALTPLGDSRSEPARDADRERFDLGASAALDFRHAQLQLGWTGASPAYRYPLSYRQQSNKLVLSLSYFF